MRRAGNVGLVRAGPISALLHVLQGPAIRILSHTLRQLYRRALLRLADVPALYLWQRPAVLFVIALAAIRPLAIAVVLLMSWGVRARLTVVRAGLLRLLLRRMLLAVLLLHPAVGLLSIAELRRRPLRRAAVVDRAMRAVRVAAIGDLQAGRCLSLLLTALKIRHGVDRLARLIHEAHLGAMRRHRAALVRHRGLLRRMHVAGYLAVGRRHGPRALTGRLAALRIRMGHARRVRRCRRLRAMRRQLLAISR